jgi:xyloglucan-specific exo-beta-1,4-glucanase
MTHAPHLSRRGLLATGAATAALPLLAPSGASAAPVTSATSARVAEKVRHTPYTFRNAEIVGGGFVTGIVFNQSEPGLVYARTDIGGAYRLDTASRRWIPLTDWIGWDEY